MSLTSLLTFALILSFFGIAFFGFGYVVRRKVGERKIRSAELRAQEIQVTAQRDAERIRHDVQKEADKYLLELKREFDEKLNLRKRELDNQENLLAIREKENADLQRKLNKRSDEVSAVGAENERLKNDLVDRKKNLERLITQELDQLQRASGVGLDEAKRLLIKRMESEVRIEASQMIKAVEDEARQMADKKASKILALAIQRCAAEHSIESTVSTIKLPNEEMKGRIIGKDGRNIRTFEQASGVDVVIDDTPGAVILSAFDPVRREIARISMDRLIEDGRIHPSSIEETVGKVRQEMKQAIIQEGTDAILELGLDQMHPELVELVGRLKYRTSYGQNALSHSKEVAYMMNVFAGELGLDPSIAKRAGLLHDIGKAVSHEVEGPHAVIGGTLARKYGEHADVVHGIEAHHEDIAAKSILPILVQAADAVSGARPGARRESLDHYVKRLEKLEKAAMDIPGVESVFAIQAGREIRVMVNPNEVNDTAMPALAREVTKILENNFQFPGQIRVTVIREMRATEFAKTSN